MSNPRSSSRLREAMRRMDFPKRKKEIGGPALMPHCPSHFVVMDPSHQVLTRSLTAELSNVVGSPCSEKISQAPPENEHGRR